MMENDPQIKPVPEKDEPHRPRAPEPTYAPFLLALGVTMLFWGFATSPIMSAGGFVFFVWASWLWIRDIARGWKV